MTDDILWREQFPDTVRGQEERAAIEKFADAFAKAWNDKFMHGGEDEWPFEGFAGPLRDSTEGFNR